MPSDIQARARVSNDSHLSPTPLAICHRPRWHGGHGKMEGMSGKVLQ